MINGTYSILFIDYGSGFFPIGCLTSNGISEEVETLDSTTVDNKGWKTQVLTNQSYNIDFSGVVVSTLIGTNNDKVGYDRLKLIKRNRELISWKIEDSETTESGQGQIISLSAESNIDEFITFSATLQGYGKPLTLASRVPSIEDGLSNSLEDGLTNSIAAE